MDVKNRKNSSSFDSSKKPKSESSLLDLYEIELITRQLERFIIRAAADKNNQVSARQGKAVGREGAELRGLRGFFARQAVAFCGSDGTVVPERRRPAGGGGGGRLAG